MLFLLINISLLSFRSSSAQNPVWEWAKTSVSSGDEGGRSTCTDSMGNVYVSGYFTGATIAFDSTNLINTSTSGYKDIFLVKYDATGNVLWAKSAGGSDNDESNKICIDLLGNIYVVGQFYSSTITFNGTTLTNGGSTGSDLFIAKYDGMGNIIWVNKFGGLYGDNGTSICTDMDDNIIITGYFNSPTITFGSTTLTASGHTDVFVTKYDSSGNVIWAKKGGGIGWDYSLGITSDLLGNTYITGYFDSLSITFGSITLTNWEKHSNDFYIVKYDGSGNVIWANNAGGYLDEFGISITVDVAGFVLVTGTFQSPSVTFGGSVLSNAFSPHSHIFIVKYSPIGSIIWASSAGGDSNDGVSEIACDIHGNILLTGNYVGILISFGALTLYNNGGYDMYIVKYDSTGNILWGLSVGELGSDGGMGVNVNRNGNIFITGSSSSSTITFGNYVLTNSSIGLFVSKLSSPVGVNELALDEYLFRAYPNPFRDAIKLSSEGKASVYDAIGKKIFEKEIYISNDNLDLSFLQNGVYFLQMDMGGRIFQRQLVKL